MKKFFTTLRTPRGQVLIEYTVLVGLIVLSLMVAIATVADQLLDILNDLREDLDAIDDHVADLDVDRYLPESDEDDTYDDS